MNKNYFLVPLWNFSDELDLLDKHVFIKFWQISHSINKMIYLITSSKKYLTLGTQIKNTLIYKFTSTFLWPTCLLTLFRKARLFNEICISYIYIDIYQMHFYLYIRMFKNL